MSGRVEGCEVCCVRRYEGGRVLGVRMGGCEVCECEVLAVSVRC